MHRIGLCLQRLHVTQMYEGISTVYMCHCHVLYVKFTGTSLLSTPQWMSLNNHNYPTFLRHTISKSAVFVNNLTYTQVWEQWRGDLIKKNMNRGVYARKQKQVYNKYKLCPSSIWRYLVR